MKAFISFFTLLFLSTVITGQVIYYDIEDEIMNLPPVPTGVGSNYNHFDFYINSDLIIDFTFVLHVSKFNWEQPGTFQVLEVEDISLKDSTFRFVKEPTQGCMKIIEENDTINSLQSWSLNNSTLAIFVQSYLTWTYPKSTYCNDPDSYKFFGFSFVSNENTHYGWMRLSWNSASVTFHDYAYNYTPNEYILAGQTESVGYTNHWSNESIAISISDNILKVTNNKHLNGNVKIRFYNMSGSYIKTADLNNDYDYVNLDEFSTGLYVIRIVHNNNYYVHKIYVK